MHSSANTHAIGPRFKLETTHMLHICYVQFEANRTTFSDTVFLSCFYSIILVSLVYTTSIPYKNQKMCT